MINLKIEKQFFKLGYKQLAGIDEAGRGPLAGPVVAASIGINEKFQLKNKELRKIKDSKKLSPKLRETLFDLIAEEFSDIGIGVVDNYKIDSLNILQANFLAMRMALRRLAQTPDIVLVDGNVKISKTKIKQTCIVKGDDKVLIIAAASIIAKVTRDRIMRAYDQKYPEYGFMQHKGYGTKLHLARLRKFGPCPIHRISFAPIKSSKDKAN